jgi:hypothetical protein
MSFLTEAYDGSFDGVAFWEQFSGMFAAEPDSGVDYASKKIPGGNSSVTDSAGESLHSFDLPIAVAATQLALLRSKASNTVRGSLDYHAGTITARLMKVKSIRKQMLDDAYLATLELIVG